MTEQLPSTNPEQQAARLEAPEPLERLADRAETSQAEAAQASRQRLAEARDTVLEQASTKNPVEDLQSSEEATTAAAEPQQINRELKRITLRRELQHIRRKLPASQRGFSHVIHQPIVRVISQAAGTTVSRPSGLLGGGLVALLGTSGYLYLAKHIGFQYNYFVFLILFVGGFVVGLALELLVHLATASRRHRSDG